VKRLTAVLGLVLALPAAGAGAPTAPRLVDGVASGDVSASSAVLWARVDPPAALHFELLSAGSVVRRAIARATVRTDGTAQVQLTKLEPDRRYSYRIWPGSTRAAAKTGSFRTFPRANRPRPVTLVVGADLGGQGRCRNKAEGGYRIFRQIANLHPDALVANGDMVYADGTCPAAGPAWQNVPGDFPSDLDVDWTDVAATRQAILAHWRYNRADPYLKALLRTTPVYAQWDDHEVANDFGALWTYWNVDSSKAGYPDLVTAGRSAFFDYWPIVRNPSEQHRIYRSFRLGEDADLFLLDARSYRSRNDAGDFPKNSKSLLGPAQISWLERSLARSTATWKLVSIDVPLFIPTCNPRYGCDSYASAGGPTGFERELLSLLSYLERHRVRNVVFLTTDVHYARTLRAAVDTDADGRPLVVYELVSGPLSAIALPVGDLDSDLAGLPAKLDSLYAEGGIYNFEVVRVQRERDGKAHLVTEVRGVNGLVRPGSRLDLAP
jgi:alkaline phosphatase D